ncbi:MAG: hypothetical protein EA368_03635 [Leptolyngbya sp. DLM2.Bin27]|nr:MAG: hypothetical protein EA368_03635 [Leptolyngbya sp. DLM2.Bin27]
MGLSCQTQILRFTTQAFSPQLLSIAPLVAPPGWALVTLGKTKPAPQPSNHLPEIYLEQWGLSPPLPGVFSAGLAIFRFYFISFLIPTPIP